MFADMPPLPPAQFVYECPEVVKYRGRTDVDPVKAAYFGRTDGGYTVKVIPLPGGHVVYTITRACAGA